MSKPQNWNEHFPLIGKCPCPPDTIVIVRHANGKITGPKPAKDIDWKHCYWAEHADVVAWQPIKKHST